MNTEMMLLARYKTPLIPFADVVQEYFGLSLEEARKRANLHRLPIKPVRLIDSQKAPLYVHVEDLARHIDQVRAAVDADWEKSQV